jgi:hypothetical protein
MISKVLEESSAINFIGRVEKKIKKISKSLKIGFMKVLYDVLIIIAFLVKIIK